MSSTVISSLKSGSGIEERILTMYRINITIGKIKVFA
jgi:hypothetical protein